MLNISKHGVRRKKSTYLNFSDSALISSEKKESKTELLNCGTHE